MRARLVAGPSGTSQQEEEVFEKYRGKKLNHSVMEASQMDKFTQGEKTRVLVHINQTCPCQYATLQ